MNCQVCRFAVKIDTGIVGEFEGECRRSPPSAGVIATSKGAAPYCIFPRVNNKMYCFSFESAQQRPLAGDAENTIRFPNIP